MTRRGVLTGAVAIAGATALPPYLRSHRIAVQHVVVDERLTHSAAFASGFADARRHTVGALEDLCSRWYTQLRRQVRADAGHIAGLSTWMDYLVMQGCAAEIGYSRSFHAEHVPVDAGIEHRVTGHTSLLQHYLGRAAPEAWAQALGVVLASGTHLRSPYRSGQIFSVTRAASDAGHMRMVSWVFSPRH